MMFKEAVVPEIGARKPLLGLVDAPDERLKTSGFGDRVGVKDIVGDAYPQETAAFLFVDRSPG
jgi:hypothetical protein